MDNNNYGGSNNKLEELKEKIKAIQERTTCFVKEQDRLISDIKIQIKEISGEEDCPGVQVFTASRGDGYGVWWSENDKDNISKRFVGTELGAEIQAILTALMQAEAKDFRKLQVNVGSNIAFDAVNNVREHRWWSEVNWSDRLALSSILYLLRRDNINVTWKRKENLHVTKLANEKKTKLRQTWSELI